MIPCGECAGGRALAGHGAGHQCSSACCGTGRSAIIRWCSSLSACHTHTAHVTPRREHTHLTPLHPILHSTPSSTTSSLNKAKLECSSCVHAPLPALPPPVPARPRPARSSFILL
ncbi:hypothetical protein RR48_04218 [Papilio machaon]|uniref:Uncharacterized protein n=1 Tax=Papilio machaon TaxID=76193 RepID=A0A0N1INZ2_PAPMA|nr:hypothetical protein RR48_04218 [Papilio machaon]